MATQAVWFLLIAGPVLSFAGLSAAPLSATESGIQYTGPSDETWDSLWATVTAKPGHIVIDEGTVTRVEIPNENAIYFFTKPNHPAHPAVVKRAVTLNNGVVGISSDGWAGGSQEIFHAWLEAFRKQDEEIRKELLRPQGN